MTSYAALTLTTAMMAAAFIQQSLEHLSPAARPPERRLFALRLLLSVLLFAGSIGIAGPDPRLLTVALVALHLLILPFFNGPYNGGADRMSLLLLLCVTAAWIAPAARWRDLALGYLGMQLLLSYFLSGWVKVVNAEWRNGGALRDVFLFSAYPAGENIRRWADRPGVLRWASWSVIGLELLFPLAFLSRPTLIAALAIAALFHAANACLFGLNRFFWIWICAYPSILWLQGRVIGG